VVGILLDDACRVFVRVERVHEDKGNIDTVSRVEVLDLAHSEVEEGHAVADFDGALWPDTAHCRPETAVKLEHSELVQDGRVLRCRQRRVRHDLLGRRRRDAIPFAVRRSRASVPGAIADQQETRKRYSLWPFALSVRYLLKSRKNECISASKACKEETA
jgi:hypothetical protein